MSVTAECVETDATSATFQLSLGGMANPTLTRDMTIYIEEMEGRQRPRTLMMPFGDGDVRLDGLAPGNSYRGRVSIKLNDGSVVRTDMEEFFTPLDSDNSPSTSPPFARNESVSQHAVLISDPMNDNSLLCQKCSVTQRHTRYSYDEYRRPCESCHRMIGPQDVLLLCNKCQRATCGKCMDNPMLEPDDAPPRVNGAHDFYDVLAIREEPSRNERFPFFQPIERPPINPEPSPLFNSSPPAETWTCCREDYPARYAYCAMCGTPKRSAPCVLRVRDQEIHRQRMYEDEEDSKRDLLDKQADEENEEARRKQEEEDAKMAQQLAEREQQRLRDLEMAENLQERENVIPPPPPPQRPRPALIPALRNIRPPAPSIPFPNLFGRSDERGHERGDERSNMPVYSLVGRGQPPAQQKDFIQIWTNPPTEAEMCTICREPYKPNDLIKRLPCTHKFHQMCVDQWLSESPQCPIDRIAVQL